MVTKFKVDNVLSFDCDLIFDTGKGLNQNGSSKIIYILAIRHIKDHMCRQTDRKTNNVISLDPKFNF